MTRYEEIDAIIKATGKRHGVSYTQIMAGGRTAEIVAARAEAMFRVRERFGFSFPHLGKIFGRDHTSVVNLYWKAKRALGGSDWLDLDDAEVTKIVIEAFKFAPRKPDAEPEAAEVVEPDEAANVSPVEFYAELRRAAKINSIWRRRGVEANARVILQDGAPVVVSSLQLVRAAR